MKLAVIAPPKYLYMIGSMGLSYHLVLPHLMDDPKYTRFYQAMHRNGHFIMVDNGAAEQIKLAWLGDEPLPIGGEATREDFQDVVTFANSIGADEIVLPDRKMDAEWTIVNTLKYSGLVEPRRRAVVPQGNDFDEWKECLKTLKARKDLYTICITKDYDALVPNGGRLRCLEFIQQCGWHLWHPIHLLGLHGNRSDPTRSMRKEVADIVKLFPWVRGVDTSAPFAYAQHHLRIDSGTTYGYDWDNPLGLDDRLAEQNIDLLRDWCNNDI